MPIDYVVYKLTFPNGKIYVGKDIGGNGHSLRYFGSWDNELVQRDLAEEELSDFTIRKEILFESKDKNEVSQKEGEFILSLSSNDQSIGYNQTHCSKVKWSLKVFEHEVKNHL
jgi:hypothetical protein